MPRIKALDKNIPRHIGFIPDGNRRWAFNQGLHKQDGYAHGISPGLQVYKMCEKYGVKEISIYGFTKDNIKRPSIQQKSFSNACVTFASEVEKLGAALLVVGDDTSAHFPKSLLRFRVRQGHGIKVNLLVNYGWEWDVAGLKNGGLRSQEVSRIDMIIRWGGGRRLSGFLPIQSVYADLYIRDENWPDFRPKHFEDALAWYKGQDKTLGG
ncbi:MAG: undecaprenyl diphosphate synthase family protein [Alphaproteobacteria bacterium]